MGIFDIEFKHCAQRGATSKCDSATLFTSKCSKYQTLGDMMKQEKFGEAPLADEGRDGYLDAILEGTVSTG